MIERSGWNWISMSEETSEMADAQNNAQEKLVRGTLEWAGALMKMGNIDTAIAELEEAYPAVITP